MGEGIGVVAAHRAQRQAPGLGSVHAHACRASRPHAGHVHEGQQGQAGRIVGARLQRASRVVLGLPQVVAAGTPEMPARPHEQRPVFAVLRRHGAVQAFLPAQVDGLHGARDGRGYGRLRPGRIIGRPLVAFGPDGLVARRVDQIGGHAHPPRVEARLASHQIAHAQFPGDRRVRRQGMAVALRRVAGDHADPARAGQPVDDVLGEAVGEVALGGIRGRAEGQHGDRPPCGGIRQRRPRGLLPRLRRAGHAAHEPVALAGDGDDAVRAHELAQGGHMHLQVVLLHDHAGPHLPEQLGLGHERAGTVDQRAQHVEGTGAQGDRAPVREQLTLPHLQHEMVKREFWGHRFFLEQALRSPPRGLHSTPAMAPDGTDVIGCNLPCPMWAGCSSLPAFPWFKEFSEQ